MSAIIHMETTLRRVVQVCRIKTGVMKKISATHIREANKEAQN